MHKRVACLVVVALVVNPVSLTTGYAKTRAAKEAQFAAKVKAGVMRLGIGPDARVEVKLRNKTKLKGYVSEVSDTYFVVADAKTGTTVNVPYPTVHQVKGHNFSSGAKIAIGVGIIVAIFVMVVLAGRGG